MQSIFEEHDRKQTDHLDKYKTKINKTGMRNYIFIKNIIKGKRFVQQRGQIAEKS